MCAKERKSIRRRNTYGFDGKTGTLLQTTGSTTQTEVTVMM